MSDTQKIDSPHGHAAGRDMQIEAAPELSVRTINGGTNIIGNHGNVSVLIGTQRKAPVRNVVQPGPEHISAEQRRMLFDLCDEWVTLHNSIKKNELLKAVAWSRINKAAGSTSYHLILRDRFDDACALVRKEMAILRGMRSAPLKDPAWRSKRIAAIKVRSTKQLGDPDAYKAYIRKNFKLDSLADLSTDQLQRTYAYIMAKKISE